MSSRGLAVTQAFGFGLLSAYKLLDVRHVYFSCHACRMKDNKDAKTGQACRLVKAAFSSSLHQAQKMLCKLS